MGNTTLPVNSRITQPKIATLIRISTAMINQCRMSRDSNMIPSSPCSWVKDNPKRQKCQAYELLLYQGFAVSQSRSALLLQLPHAKNPPRDQEDHQDDHQESSQEHDQEDGCNETCHKTVLPIAACSG
jgi:hypothetical protein